MVHETEWEDVEALFKRYSRRKNEFQISETREPIGTQLQALRGTVTFTNLRTGATKEYQTGYGSSWIAELEEDLREGNL